MKDGIEKQWEQDVADYGDNAYLLWEGYAGVVDEYECWQDIGSNEYWNCPIEVRRKDSAALMFDLERARSGDVVEIQDLYGWRDCHSKTYQFGKFPLIRLDNFSVSEFILRMKYPKNAPHGGLSA